ncbi:MAG: right-handed parallel beta-helix repeat-containing protein [Thermoguttaceae bacterium]|jgi:hypothetical protein
MPKKRFLLGFLSILLLASGLCAEGIIPPDEAKLAALKNGQITEAKASWWGFNPEDSTVQFQAALNSGVKKLTIDKMSSDWVIRPVELRSNMEIFFDEGVRVAAKRGDFQSVGACLWALRAVENVSIHGNGGSLKMWKEDYLDENKYKLGEWRHAISLTGAKNILIEDLSIIESGGDGIYVGAGQGNPCQDITIRRVISDGNNRQGISIITVDGLLVEDSVFKNTGGTMPMAGLDIEPNSPTEVVKRTVFRNCLFDSNRSDGICLYLVQFDANTEPIDVLFENCVTRSNGANGFAFTTKTGGEETQLKGRVVVRNCRFEGDNVGMIIQAKTINGCELEFENVKMVNPSTAQLPEGKPHPAPIQIYSQTRDTLKAGKIDFNNLEIVDPLDREKLVYIDSSRMGVGITDITGTITVRKTEQGPIDEVIELNNEYLEQRFPQLNPKQIPLVKTKANDFVPYNELHAGAYPYDAVAPGIRARNQGDFRLYANKGQTVQFHIKEYPYGDCARDKVVPKLTSPGGKVTDLEPCDFLGEKDYEFTADETGVYRLFITVNPHNFVFSGCNVPFVYWAEPYGMTIQNPGTFYFYVPENTPAFALKLDTCPAEPFAFTVLDPQGKKSGGMDYLDSTIIWSADGTPEPGIWTLVIEDTDKHALDDICFNLLGIPSYLATQKGAVFVEKP